MTCAIQITELRKSYGSHEVLKGLTFNVKQGEIFGILGVNGAGKTTALECIEGFRRADSGTIQCSGTIGIQLQSASLPSYIKSMEAVKLFAKWKKTEPDADMLKALGIGELAEKNYTNCSTGQKRRLHLALAMTGNPDILFLDEPTAGLDVEGRIALHQEIRRLKDRGKTIVLASHDMSEVEDLCDRIAILNHGKIAFLGTIDELALRADTRYRIQIVTENGEDEYTADQIADTLLKVLENYKQRQLAILDIKISRGSLEQHFIELAKEA